MALQLIQPHDRYILKRDVIDRRAGIGHLLSVLNACEESFDGLENIAIREFRDGIRHPATGDLLIRCDNGPGGAAPKRALYIQAG